jgi:hypothetical protein
MISCEAFLLNDIEEHGELQFRLALRAAYLLGKTSGEKKAIFKFAKRAYNIRSKIAHGNALTDKEIELLPDAVDFCRRVAKEMVILHSCGRKPDWNSLQFQ